jgi:hypothetical protein
MRDEGRQGTRNIGDFLLAFCDNSGNNTKQWREEFTTMVRRWAFDLAPLQQPYREELIQKAQELKEQLK